MLPRRLRELRLRRRSVRDDWIARLPAEKARLFEGVIAEWNAAYGMLSVTLNEALALRADGRFVSAREQAANCADLLDRLAVPLVSALRAMEDHGRHFGTLPAIEPLNPAFFRGEAAQHAASKNSILHRVLLSGRPRFFHKLRTLANTTEELGEEFHAAATDLAEGTCTQPAALWTSLDSLHYDLNTCLRETVVVLKSFLCALPSEEVEAFRRKLEAPAPVPSRHLRLRLSRASS